MLSLLTACSLGSASEGSRLWCNTNHPIVVYDDQWAGMTEKQRKQTLGHNEYGTKICGKAWAKAD